MKDIRGEQGCGSSSGPEGNTKTSFSRDLEMHDSIREAPPYVLSHPADVEFSMKHGYGYGYRIRYGTDTVIRQN